ncbi:cyclic nucleotide-binding domain-containing protein [Leptospira biflexa]|jgi:CRP-like cAMP-binding protein|uniref:Putative cyclic-nucleotide binding protein n=1 Tax=Leptospira biflexa serovar Patoc (strain Patoc 1 / ATCC 23582 / Paris) TaxID=456481 RepID=B0SKK1_LEPBP|nr:cyclic nucleotide-binding domain-containing protein [Leptospira biflexa]ABZ93136.1 Cyclic nucleotide binding protein [Leptospira biflexa serovar Patoc strain 'Patoc 1 (Ames)']ABZ96758.1 Putative cyclic-nucleotide binding protein [Leptospira biflexa serovar Patoc strain 'Patoc 1 (Paris)']TGM47571.1 cyclic nucleotide-binding domain-containing protein [Leptospira biflexa]TGM49963.1 cyclic nucleotide-binding domain-containing protein [Leptospira biflexa]
MGLKESLAKLSMINIKRGEVLFKEGVPSNGAMFFLFEGQLDIYKQIDGKHTKLRSILPGEFFGEMAIINNSPRAASIVVVSESAKLGIINRTTFVQMSQESPEFLFLLLKKVIERLYETDGKIRAIKRKQDEDSMISKSLPSLSNDGASASNEESLGQVPLNTFTDDAQSIGE